MSIEETPEAHKLRMHRLEKAKALRQSIGTTNNRARLVFEKLMPGQKRYLLAVSGITYSGNLNELKLTDHQIESLYLGLSRLKSLIADFSACSAQDFKPVDVNKQITKQKAA